MWQRFQWIITLCGGVLLGITACAAPTTPTQQRLSAVPPTATALPSLTCEFLPEALTCVDANGLMLLQTDRNTTVTVAQTFITVDGTTFVDRNADTSIIAALEGTTVISIGNNTRVLQPGAQITLTDFSTANLPTAPQPYAIERARIAPLNALPRAIILPEPIGRITDASPARGNTTPTEQSGCIPDEEWPFLYTVQRGDTLTRIAGMHDLTTAELWEGNCITDPNALQPGDILRVPINIAEGLPEIPARFYADREAVPPGECATLYWQTENAEAVFLNMQPVDANATLEVCPSQTSDYILRVRFPDEVEATYTVRLLVVIGDDVENIP